MYRLSIYIKEALILKKNSILSGNTTMLILSLLENGDLYGYQMIAELANQSNNLFSLKAGTLYPILHQLEELDLITSYDLAADSSRIRKYYHLTKTGQDSLNKKKEDWYSYSSVINKVLKGGISYGQV